MKLIRIFLIVLLSLLIVTAAVAAVPLAAPLQAPRVVTVFPTTVITTDTYSSNFVWGTNTEADFFYIVDQDVGNALNIFLYVSPDAVDWYSHNTEDTILGGSTTTDKADYYTVPIEGYQARLKFAVANANPVTITVKAVLRGY